MIEAVAKQDVQEFQEHIERLYKKYGPDFFFFGVFGVEIDETENSVPVVSEIGIVGQSALIHYGLHHLLEHKPGVESIMDTLRCHLKHEVSSGEEFYDNMRDLTLLVIKKALLEHIDKEENSEIEKEVDNFLKEIGFKK